MSDSEKVAKDELEKKAIKNKNGKKYVVKFDHDKTVYIIERKNEKTGKVEKKKCAKETEGAKKIVIKDKRTQLRLAVNSQTIITLRKDEEITEEQYNLLSPIAQKEYIKIV